MNGLPQTPCVLYVHFHAAEALYERLLALLGGFTPVVQALPPDAALADVRGALRYFGRDAVELATLLRVRLLALHGVDCTIGVGPNPLLARMAAQGGPQGAVRAAPCDPAAVAAFLAERPVAALHGTGPATARQLGTYGLDTVGRVASAPLATLQRILGAAAGRRTHERARGIDPTPVVPNAPARSAGAEHRFGHDELDPVRHRRALLSLTEELGSALRVSGRVAGSLTLTVRYADRSTTTRTRALPEPTGHGTALTEAAYRLYEGLGLQRARVRALALRAEGLMDAGLAPLQLSLDPGAEKARRIEAVADRARARFGPRALMPAALGGAA